MRSRFANIIVLIGTLLITTASVTGTVYNISIGNFFYSPTNTTVAFGDTVRWKNTAGTHTTTSDGTSPKSWDSGIISVGDSFDVVFDVPDGPGPFPYHCAVHPFSMADTIFVDTCAHQNPGDVNGSGSINISDGIYLINYGLAGGPPPMPYLSNGDPNGDCVVDYDDPCYIMAYIFSGGPAPVICTCLNPTTGDTCAFQRPGDVEINCVINNGDLTFLNNYLCLGGQAPLVKANADVDGDCDIDTFDVIYLVDYLNNGGPAPVTCTCVDPVVIGCSSDTCAGQKPGDANSNGSFEIGDIAYLINFLCSGGPAPNPLANGDPDGDCDIDTFDIVYLRDYIFSAGPPPVTCTCLNPTVKGCFTPVNVCDSSYTDPVFLICPGGDAFFTVHLRDPLGNPVIGDSSVYVQFNNCSGIDSCTSLNVPYRAYPLAPSDGSGRLFFAFAGGGCDNLCEAVVTADCGTIATVPVRSFDTNGDLGVSFAFDWAPPSECNNYDGNPGVTNGDLQLFLPHIGHFCGLGPCERIGYEFVLDPGSNLMPGQQVTLKLIITNNNFDACTFSTVSFYSSGFGTGENYQFISSVLLNHTLAPGQKDSAVTAFTVPPDTGLGCFRATVLSSCCPSVTLQECARSTWQCAANAGLCYETRIRLNLTGGETIYGITIPSLGLPPG